MFVKPLNFDRIKPISGTNNSNGRSESFKSSPKYLTAETLWEVFPICFIVLGTIGNILCILVLMKAKNRHHRGSVYLIVLAFADITVLYSGLMREWVLQIFGLDLKATSEGMCKLNLFFNSFSIGLSSWLLLAITFDRVIIIFFPYCVKHRYAKSSPVMVISCIVFILIAMHAHLLWGYGTHVITRGNITQTNICEYKTENYKTFFRESYSWINFVLQFIFPYVALSIGNTLIIVKMKSLQKKIQPNLEDKCTKNISSIGGNETYKTLPRKGNVVSVQDGVDNLDRCHGNDFQAAVKGFSISERERKKKVLFDTKTDYKEDAKLKNISVTDGINENHLKNGEINKEMSGRKGTSNEIIQLDRKRGEYKDLSAAERKFEVLSKIEKDLQDNIKTNEISVDEGTEEVLFNFENCLQKCEDLNNIPETESKNKAISSTEKEWHKNENLTLGETRRSPWLPDVRRRSHTTETKEIFLLRCINNDNSRFTVDVSPSFKREKITWVSELNDEIGDISDKNVQQFYKPEIGQRKYPCSQKNQKNHSIQNGVKVVDKMPANFPVKDEREKNKTATVSFKRQYLTRKPSGYSIAVSRNEKVNTLTKTLVILNTVFLICNAPIGIFQVYRRPSYKDATQQQLAELSLWWVIVNMFMYFNYAINFLLYCLSGSKFRDDLKQMFTQCRKN